MMSYTPSMQRAIAYMETHLDQPIQAGEVAKVAGFSLYHFHRIFQALSGETLMGYLRKRRLSHASNLLIGTKQPILDIALHCQFESQAAFTRAFKRMFGLNPGQYRTQNLGHPLSERPPLSDAILKHLERGITMQPKILHQTAIQVIGIEETFKPMDPGIAALWERFGPRTREVSRRVGGRSFGICQADAQGQEAGNILYMAAVEVDSLADVPPGMAGRTLPAHTYAVFTHTGPLSRLPDTLRYIWGTWLPKSGYQQADLPDFELYDDRFDPTSEDSQLDLYLPVTPIPG